MITFDDIPVVQACCLRSHAIKWFVQLPWKPFGREDHLVGTHSLSHTLGILDTLISIREDKEDDDSDEDSDDYYPEMRGLYAFDRCVD